MKILQTIMAALIVAAIVQIVMTFPSRSPKDDKEKSPPPRDRD